MLETLMRSFDRLVPDRVKWDVKEYFFAFDYYKTKMWNVGMELFSQIEIETNTDCNRSCRICPRHNEKRPLALMDNKLYKRLLSQLEEIDFKGRFSPVFYNEPLLDDRLPDMVALAKERLPEITVMIYTNGSMLDEDNVYKLSDSGVDIFIISQYIQNIPKDDKSSFIKALPKDLRRKMRYRVLYDDSALSNRGGLVQVENPMKKSRCYRSSTALILDYQGNVVLCSNDYYTGHRFGNIGDRHILSIWNDPEYKRVRKELRKGNFEYEMCKRCVGIEGA